MTIRALAVILLASVVVTGSAVTSTHRVWEREQFTQVLWNSRAAYIFVGMSHSGWSGNYLQLGWQAVRNYLGASTQIQNTKNSIIVLTVTAAGLERVMIPDAAVATYNIFDDQLYGQFKGRLAKWTGRTFQPLDAAEVGRFEAAKRQPNEYDGIQGWSKRTDLLSDEPGRKEFTISLGTRNLTMIVSKGAHPERWKAIDLRDEGGVEQRVFYIEEGPRTLSSAEYSEMFTVNPGERWF